MCYNYETMIRAKIKKGTYFEGKEAALESLTDFEKKILEQSEPVFDLQSGESPSGLYESSEEETHAESTFPGAEVQVISITTRQREYYLFGFMADWVKQEKDQRKNFNARTDSLRTKPTWKKAWYSGQRCLVCATGFYEDDRPNKTRYFFSVKGKDEIFFAGIFNH